MLRIILYLRPKNYICGLNHAKNYISFSKSYLFSQGWLLVIGVNSM